MILAIHIILILMVLVGVAIVVATSNIIHAAYALCLTLLGLAGIYVIMMAELLAVVQIMIYAGGVVILLVFGVMMTHRMKGGRVLSGSKNKIFGVVFSIGVFVVLVYLISNASFETAPVIAINQVEKIGISFLSQHLLAFEFIAFILLVALVGAAYLARNAAND